MVAVAIILSTFFSASFAESKEIDTLEPIIFQPDWFPNAQFSGFFWAKEDGIFKEHGLEVNFEKFAFGSSFIGAVSSGQAAFGTSEAYILMEAVARGEPLVALGAVLDVSPAGYIFLKDSGIETGADLKDKTVGVHNYAEALLPFFVNKAGLAADSVVATTVQHNIETLLDGDVDLHQGYAIDEMIRLKAKTSREVEILLFEDLGMPMYSMVIYSSREFVQKNPDLVEAFLQASAKGWERAMRSPAVAAMIVNGPYADSEVDNEIIEDQAIALKPFVNIDGRATLSMSRAKWEAMQAAFLESGMIDAPVNLDAMLYQPNTSP